jgi:hypothetical protein
MKTSKTIPTVWIFSPSQPNQCVWIFDPGASILLWPPQDFSATTKAVQTSNCGAKPWMNPNIMQ